MTVDDIAVYIVLGAFVTSPVAQSLIPTRRHRRRGPGRSRGNLHALYQIKGRRQITRLGMRQRIYTGITNNPSVRFRAHSKKPWWRDARVIKINHHLNRRRVAAAERRNIQTHPTRENIIYNRQR